MSPGQTRGDRQTKRRRVAKTNNDHDQFANLMSIRNAQIDEDNLSSPLVRSALNSFLQKRKLSPNLKKDAEFVLRGIKSSLDALSTKGKTMEVDSPIVRNVIRKVASASSLNSLFHSPDYEALSVKCSPPTKINVVGSFLLGYACEPVVDVAVEMPASLFHSKDYLNYQYHDKRLLYLFYLARHFLKDEQTKWAKASVTKYFLNNDSSKPLLSLSMAERPEVTVCIIPTCAGNTFEASRLEDNRRNVRPAGVSSLVEGTGTIAYNHGILMDSTLLTSLQSLHAVAKSVPAFVDTVLLLCTWCTRHRLLSNRFIMASVVADVIQRKIAPERASREHLLRCALNSIRGGLLAKIKIDRVRLCASYNAGMLERMEECATTALRIIESKVAAEDPWYGILPYLFATARGLKQSSRPLCTLFDGFLRISVEDGEEFPAEEELSRVFQHAFVDTGRVARIECLQRNLFGLTITSSDDMYRKVDMRPKDCDSSFFKSFWGEKAELRRFKDGTIIESLVWTGGVETLHEIASYVIGQHFGGNMSVNVILGDLDVVAGTADDMGAKQAITVFNELANTLRSIEGLPLSILAVQATSPYLRWCGAYPIRPSTSSRFIQPLDIVASFETTSKWPNDSIAIAAAKAAFYLALKSTLATKGLSSEASISFIDISLAGFVFRLRLRVDKEKHLLPEGSENACNLMWETEARVQHHDMMRRVGNPLFGNVVRLVKQWLNAHLLLCQMGSRAEEMIELMVASIFHEKRTTAAKSTMAFFCQVLHLLAEFPWEVCPLSVLLKDDDDDIMESGNTGREVDREADLKRFMESAQKRFSEKLDGAPALSIYSAWNEDEEDVETWFPATHNAPKVIADRIRVTALSSLSFIDKYVMNCDSGISLGSLFSTPLEVYDAVLELDESFVASGVSKGIFRSRGAVASDSLLVGFDPVELLVEELRKSLGQFALFFMQYHGRAQIFVLWRPEASSRVKFSLRKAAFMEPRDDGQLEPSKEAMLEEMRRIGTGFIKHITFASEQ